MENSIFSEIRIITLEKFKIARSVAISPCPEEMAISYMDNWAKKNGLLDCASYNKKGIGWDFPYVSEEQQRMFGLRGYVCAYVIPDDFIAKYEGAEFAYIDTDTYATLTITDPHSNSFENIPKAYQILFAYAKTSSWKNRLAFEEEYDVDGVHYMDVYVPMN